MPAATHSEKSDEITMIIDTLENRGLYGGLPSRLVTALTWLAAQDAATLPLGRNPIDGDNIFALVQDYQTRPVEQCVWEAHRRYHDVQFLAPASAGSERIGYAPLGTRAITTLYDAQKDAEFFAPPVDGCFDSVTLRPGMFAILMPHDIHMPCALAGSSALVRKIVIKVAV